MPWNKPLATRLLTALMLASVGGLTALEQPLGELGGSAASSGYHPSPARNDAAPAR